MKLSVRPMFESLEDRLVMDAAGSTSLLRDIAMPVETPVQQSELRTQEGADYAAIVFVGGWGASSYQYAFAGTYANSAYNGAAEKSTDVFAGNATPGQETTWAYQWGNWITHDMDLVR